MPIGEKQHRYIEVIEPEFGRDLLANWTYFLSKVLCSLKINEIFKWKGLKRGEMKDIKGRERYLAEGSLGHEA